METALKIPETKKAQAFISYSSKDKPFVDKLCHDLEKFGITIFRPETDILPGEIWSSKIEEAINKSDVFIVAVSTNTEKSLWSHAEIAMAVTARQDSKLKKIIPLLLEAKAKLPPFLDGIQYVDFSETSNHEEKLASLIHSVKTAKQDDPLQVGQQQSLELQLIEAEKLFRKIEESRFRKSSLNNSNFFVKSFLMILVITGFFAGAATGYFAPFGKGALFEVVQFSTYMLSSCTALLLGYLFGKQDIVAPTREKKGHKGE